MRRENQMDNELFYEYADLVRKYKSGDEEAFSEIYDRSSRFVYMTCLNTLGNPEDAQDAMQETYLTVVNDIGKLEDNEKFLGWIKKIAVYKSIDIQRKRRDGISYDDAIETEEILEGDDDLESLPEYFIEEKAKREELHKIIKNVLSEDQYQTILFYYFNEMSVKEIADVTGCPEGTIKRRLQNSRIKIKSGVEKYEKKTGDKLGAAAIGISFLGRFFKEEALGLHVPDISTFALSVGSTLPESAAHSATEAAEKAIETTEKAAEATAETLKSAASAAQKASEASSGTARQAASAAGRAAKTSFFATTGGKVAIVATSLVVLIGAGIGIKALIDNNTKDVDDEDEEEIVETTAQATETTQPIESTPSEPAPSETTETTVDLTDPYQAPDTGWAAAYSSLMAGLSVYDFNDGYVEYDIENFMTAESVDDLQILFDLVYINNDTVPELVASVNLSSELRYTNLYTYSGGNAILLKAFQTYQAPELYVPSENRVAFCGDYLPEHTLYSGFGSISSSGTEFNETYPDCWEYLDYSYCTGYYDDYTVEKEAEYEAIFGFEQYTYIELVGAHTLSEMLGLMPASVVTDSADVSDCYSAPDSGWASAYCDVVMNIDIANIPAYYQEDMTSDQIKCDLLFINSDQIPELVICYTNSYNENFLQIYTFVNGEAIFVDDFSQDKFTLKYIPGGNNLQTNGALYFNGPDIVKSTAAYSMTADGTAFTYIAGYNSNFDITLDTVTDADISEDYDRYFTYTPETGYVEVPEAEYNALFVDGGFVDLSPAYSIFDFLNNLPIETPSADQIPNYFPAPTPTPKPASGNDEVMPA